MSNFNERLHFTPNMCRTPPNIPSSPHSIAQKIVKNASDKWTKWFRANRIQSLIALKFETKKVPFGSQTTIHSVFRVRVSAACDFVHSKPTKHKREWKFDFSVEGVMMLHFFPKRSEKKNSPVHFASESHTRCVARNYIWPGSAGKRERQHMEKCTCNVHVVKIEFHPYIRWLNTQRANTLPEPHLNMQ